MELSQLPLRLLLYPFSSERQGLIKQPVRRGLQQELYVSNTLHCTDTALAQHVSEFHIQHFLKKVLAAAYTGFMNIYIPLSKSLRVLFPKNMKDW